jgi:di/tricarboxylate transporter
VGRPSREWIGWSLALVLPLLLYPLMLWIGTPIPGAFFTAVLGAMVVLWVFSLVDEFIPPLFATVAILFVGLAPPSIALAGFASSSLLTLVGVFALSAVINATGLGQRLMFWLLLRLPDRPFWHQTVLLVGGCLMSPIMPSGNSRLAIMLPMFRNMADGCRLAPGGRAITGLMAASFAGSMLFSPMMSTSKSSNIAAIALLPQQVQTEFLGIFWLVAAGVAALGLTVLHIVALRLVFGNGRQDPLPRQDLEEQLARRGPMGPDEWVAAACFAFFLVGATTVSWHHVQPAWLAGFVVVGLLVTGVLGKPGFRGQIDWPMIFFLLGLDSVTRVMKHVGLDAEMARSMGDLYGFIDGRFPMFILASLLTTLVIRSVLPLTAGMIVSTIVLLPVAAAEGIHPWLCVFLTALFSDIWFFRYQSSVYLQAVSSGAIARIDEPAFLRYNHLMNLARVLVAYASIPWWHWLGLL